MPVGMEIKCCSIAGSADCGYQQVNWYLPYVLCNAFVENENCEDPIDCEHKRPLYVYTEVL